MKETELFIAILKATPDNSFVSTTGFMDYDTAAKLGVINFKEFRPESVGLAFELTSKNREFWIDHFKNKDIIDDLLHYWIYHNNAIIGNGFDFFEINNFDKNYYQGKLNGFEKDFDFYFTENLTSGIPDEKRLIELIETHEYQGNYSIDIVTEINKRILKLRFAIEKTDFDCLTLLLNEKGLFNVEFIGLHFNEDDSARCGLTMSKNSAKIDLWIKVTKKFVSNLLWFQQLENEKEIEQMII